MRTKKRMTYRKGLLFTLSLLSSCSIILLVLLSSTAKVGNQELYGTWRLVSITNTVVATGETENPRGKSPHGFINYGLDGRMLVLVVNEKAAKAP